MHEAAAEGRVVQLQQLIKDGAAVNTVAVDSITPLHEACIRGQAQCVRLLLDAGAQVRPRKFYTYYLLQHLLQNNKCPPALVCLFPERRLCALQVEARNIDGSTPLCDACAAGSLECVKLLLEYGATVNPPLFTFSPLHEACMSGKSVFHRR